jgi:cytochrome P450
MLSLLTILVSSSATIYAIYLFFSTLDLKLRAKEATNRHGCKPISQVSSFDPIFGLDTFIKIYKANSAGHDLELYRGLHQKYGHTFMMKPLQTQLNTSSSENIQAICTSQFNNFGVGPMRGNIGAPFIGRGIFTEDGQFWKHSRALIKPIFSRAEIADLENFERHVARFLASIPNDGDTFDMLALAKKLVSLLK